MITVSKIHWPEEPATVDDLPDDGLAPAKGIARGVLIGIASWPVIAALVWWLV